MKKPFPPPKIRLIVNPAAGRGASRRALGRIAKNFARERITDTAISEKSGDEARLADAAISDGIETIIAVGGDGTCTRIANVILARGSSCRLGVIPTGTGNDFAKTLGTAKLGQADIARLSAASSIARMDVGKVDDLYFLNGCGFGIDPEILAASLRTTWLRGSAVYIVSALRKLFSYRGLDISGTGDGVTARRLMMLTVSNGRSLGGAFKIAPSASVCDGVLDVHSFGDARAGTRLKIFLAALRGTHPSLEQVRFEQHSSLSLAFESPPEIEVDGELRRAANRNVHIECVPGALSVVAAPGYPL